MSLLIRQRQNQCGLEQQRMFIQIIWHLWIICHVHKSQTTENTELLSRKEGHLLKLNTSTFIQTNIDTLLLDVCEGILSGVRLCYLWTTEYQASLSFTISRNLLKFMSIEFQWCYQTISFSSAPFSLCLPSFQASGSFPVSLLFVSGGHKYWSFNFSISLSNEYSGLISFWDWLVWSPCSPRDSPESSPAPQFESINFLVLSGL